MKYTVIRSGPSDEYALVYEEGKEEKLYVFYARRDGRISSKPLKDTEVQLMQDLIDLDPTFLERAYKHRRIPCLNISMDDYD